jgi:hypothetical protein
MKIDFKKIINIKNKKNLKYFYFNKPIFQKNYLFHYLIEFNNLNGLKLLKYPIYIENIDNLNGFHIAAKVNNIKILEYLIENYSEYIYNRNNKKEAFTFYLDVEHFTNFIKKYPKLDWNDLIINGSSEPNEIFKNIILNLKYKKIIKFLKIYNIKPTNDNNFLFEIILSNLLSNEEKIKILNNYTDEELNLKSKNNGIGIIMFAIENNNIFLLDYLINRNVDINYYTLIKTNSPLSTALNIDIMNNNFLLSKKIFEKTDYNFLKTFDCNLNNIIHSCLFIRLNRNELIQSINQTVYPELEIFKNLDSELWNQLNIDKISPLELLIELDFNIYSKIIIDNNIKINPNILKQTKSNKKWFNLYQKQPVYLEEKDNIIIDLRKENKSLNEINKNNNLIITKKDNIIIELKKEIINLKDIIELNNF